MATVQIDDEFWTYLNRNKERGETFNDVLQRLCNFSKEIQEEEDEYGFVQEKRR